MSLERTITLILAIFLTLHSYGQQATISDFGFYEFENPVTEDTLLYRLLKPYNYDSLAAEEYPVFIWMHPNGRQGTNNTSQMNDGWAQFLMDSTMRVTFPAFVMAPQCKPNNFWNSGSYYRNVMDLIENLKTVEKIDANRIYVMGWSMGSFAAWGMVTDAVFPNYFAAAVPIAGSGFPGANFDPAPFENTFIWAGHGTNDGVINVTNTRNVIKLIRDTGYDALYSEFPVGHGSHDETMNEPSIFTWIFSQNRAGGNLPPVPTNFQVNTSTNIATLTWDIPTVTSSVDSIMAYNVYKNGLRLNTAVNDLADSTGTGINELLRTNLFVDSTYVSGDTYEVKAVNFRNQESLQINTYVSESRNEENRIFIYPNPVKDVIYIENLDQLNINYSLFSISGARILQGKLSGNRLNISTLQNGIYLLKVGGHVFKLLKQ